MNVARRWLLRMGGKSAEDIQRRRALRPVVAEDRRNNWENAVFTFKAPFRIL